MNFFPFFCYLPVCLHCSFTPLFTLDFDLSSCPVVYMIQLHFRPNCLQLISASTGSREKESPEAYPILYWQDVLASIQFLPHLTFSHQSNPVLPTFLPFGKPSRVFIRFFIHIMEFLSAADEFFTRFFNLVGNCSTPPRLCPFSFTLYRIWPVQLHAGFDQFITVWLDRTQKKNTQAFLPIHLASYTHGDFPNWSYILSDQCSHKLLSIHTHGQIKLLAMKKSQFAPKIQLVAQLFSIAQS